VKDSAGHRLTLSMRSAINTVIDPPKTLLDFAGVNSEPNRLSESVLLIVDSQKEYSEGKVHLVGLDAAIAEAARLLDRARELETPVIHVTHENKAGSALFESGSKFIEVMDELRPRDGEAVISKTMANSFFNSTLGEEIEKTGRRNLVVIGYMTHMAVDSTVRIALERGFKTTVVGNACAARDLSDGYGNVISAATVHTATLAILRDRFAAIVRSGSELPD
ncbi:MAG: cysteine hydrolase family protein, partial [Pyrinomonadaceae bacterium]